jgi:hypothetical protein
MSFKREPLLEGWDQTSLYIVQLKSRHYRLMYLEKHRWMLRVRHLLRRLVSPLMSSAQQLGQLLLEQQ